MPMNYIFYLSIEFVKFDLKYTYFYLTQTVYFEGYGKV